MWFAVAVGLFDALCAVVPLFRQFAVEIVSDGDGGGDVPVTGTAEGLHVVSANSCVDDVSILLVCWKTKPNCVINAKR